MTDATKSKAKVLWTENADGSWTGIENVPYGAKKWYLVKDASVTHRTKITELRDPMDRPSRIDKPTYDAAKRYVARWFA